MMFVCLFGGFFGGVGVFFVFTDGSNISIK